MRRVIGFVILAAIVIAIAWWVAGLPGQIAATISGTQIQTSVPVALLLLLVLFVILYVIVRLLGGLWRTPRRIRRRRRERHRRAGDRAVTRTLIALAAGEAGNARREAGRARRLLGDTPQTLLLAAEAARRAGRAEEAAADYRLLAAREDAAFLGLHGLMRQAIAREDWAGATELAQQAERAHPASDWLRSERAQLAIRAGKWREALEVSPLDASHAGARAALAAAAADAAPDTESGRRLGKQAFDMDPKLVPAALAYARRLRKDGRRTCCGAPGSPTRIPTWPNSRWPLPRTRWAGCVRRRR
jgi:HemY protein